MAPLRLVARDFERVHDAERQRPEGCTGKHVSACGNAQIFDQVMLAGDKSAHHAERFGEIAHVHIDAVDEAVVFERAFAVFTQYARGVGIVHHQHGIVHAGEFHELGQTGDIAVHAE